MEGLFSKLNLGMLGYGAQGRAEALNLRRSQVRFSLGLRSGPSFDRAKSDGFSPISPESCVQQSDALLINLPDQIQGKIYEELIANSQLQYLIFAHGFSTTFKKIPVSVAGPKHILIAPKGAAAGLIQYYGTTSALPAILAFQSAEGVATTEEKNGIEALALALGCHPQALIWARFQDEAVSDLFSEQALLCGGVSELVKNAYDVLVENGYHPEAAYFETLFELKLIVDMIWTSGIQGMRQRISPTARYGDITRGPRVIDSKVKEQMVHVLREIESGKFATEFLERIDSPEFKAQLQKQNSHPIEKIGAELRKKMGVQ